VGETTALDFGMFSSSYQEATLQSRRSPSSPPSCASASGTATIIPLRKWISGEAVTGHPLPVQQNKQSIIRKTTVAYAIAELLNYCIENEHGPNPHDLKAAPVAVDNFVVRVGYSSRGATIEGVEMLSPAVSLRIDSPFFLSDDFFRGSSDYTDPTRQQQQELGQFLEVEIQNNWPISNVAVPYLGLSEESAVCHLFGALLYELYSEMPLFSCFRAGQMQVISTTSAMNSMNNLMDESDSFDPLSESFHSFSSLSPREPSRKKTVLDTLSLNDQYDNETANGNSSQLTALKVSRDNASRSTALKDLGLPGSISLLIKDLMDCGWGEFLPNDALSSLKAASKDLHLLLLEPDRFLFDRFLDQGGCTLNFKQDKLYGREAERSLITDVFCRVSFTGQSEAFFIEGFSGSGKSKLVSSVVEYADVEGAYVIQKKFDQISQERPISVVIAAFNELCLRVREKNSPQELNDIIVELMAVFGAHLKTLARLLPSVTLLIPGLDDMPSDIDQDTDINLSSVYFILQLFTRVVSSKFHPIMLFLDDIHWSDSASLDVLHSILTDIKGASCIYIISSYRNNEVSKDHAIFSLINDLKARNVPLTTLHLDGMEIDDVNQLVSDALGLFPRICKPLSQLVLRKTKGNPLFIQECLRSLVDRGSLRYSFRERRWVWDNDTISPEDIADNVCELLSTKMTALSENTQLALKVASCFGTTLNSTIVKTLMSASASFSSLQNELEKAVDDNFMLKDGSTYRFIHDKVREAAYGLIRKEERNQFHHRIGTLLYNTAQGQDIDDMIYFIADQINHGTPENPKQRIDIAELNYKAASNAMRNSNFAAAYFYSNAAIKLLPQNHWDLYYDLSKGIFLVLGNAAVADGRYKEATHALDQILTHGKSLTDKLDGHYLKITMLANRQQFKLAYDAGVEVLRQLGETIPVTVNPESIANTVKTMQAKLDGMSERDWMGFKNIESSFNHSLMQFYNQVENSSYFVNFPMFKWFSCRIVQLSLEHGFCKYSAVGMIQYATILAGQLINDVQGAYKIGKMVLKLSERFDAMDIMPYIYMTYYGYIAVHIEPFQSCADMLKRGFEIGLSTGDVSSALFNGIHYIQKSLVSGANLSVLKKECDYQMRLVEAHSLPVAKMYMSPLQETIALLSAREGYSDLTRSDDVSKVTEFSESLTFHGVIQTFWFGHYDRCIFYAEKSSASPDMSQLKSIMTLFYGALSCFHCSKRGQKKHMHLASQAVNVIREKAKESSWNYQNKIHLLQAQFFSANGERDNAKASFEAAITAARKSKFPHEEGLACEYSALHCIKNGENKDGLELLEKAKDCYKKWGSQVKVDAITKRIEKIAAKVG